MKSSISQILFICIVQLCILQIKSQKQTNVIFYEHKEFKGAQYPLTVKEGHCHNLDAFNKKASSINTGGACLFVYDQSNCRGNWKQISPVARGHNNLNDWSFNDQISSVQFCSNFPDRELEAIWKPRYFFDRGNQCYPSSPSKNGQCPGFDSNAPLYYDRRECTNYGTLRIQYWLFYGYQKKCSNLDTVIGKQSNHDNDWEHVTLNLKKCDGTWCLSSITFSQHGGWYTRAYQGSIDIYVGKIGHGNYYDSCCWLAGCYSKYCSADTQCLPFNDFRDPNKAGWIPSNSKPMDHAVAFDLDGLDYPEYIKMANTINNKWERDTCGATMFQKCKDQCEDNNSEL